PPSPTSTYAFSLHDALPILLEIIVYAFVLQQPRNKIKIRFAELANVFALRILERKTGKIEIGAACHAGIGQHLGYDLNNVHFQIDRKSTRLNSSHVKISYAV